MHIDYEIIQHYLKLVRHKKQRETKTTCLHVLYQLLTLERPPGCTEQLRNM